MAKSTGSSGGGKGASTGGGKGASTGGGKGASTGGGKGASTGGGKGASTGGGKGASYGGGKSSGSGATAHVLYGVWIDHAVKSNDVNEMKAVLQEARKHFPPTPQPLYAVWIHHSIEKGASKQELEQLLEHAKAAMSSDLQGAIKKLEQHLGKK